jgi:hypothetical protein
MIAMEMMHVKPAFIGVRAFRHNAFHVFATGPWLTVCKDVLKRLEIYARRIGSSPVLHGQHPDHFGLLKAARLRVEHFACASARHRHCRYLRQ